MTTTTAAPPTPTDALQRAVAEAPEGPIIVLGGPGTGKTHTLKARIACLLKGGASPHTITYLTFSSKAAEDLQNLLHQDPATKAASPHIFAGTIHHYASHFLREEGAKALGISPHYTIWDHQQAMEILIEISDAMVTPHRPKVPSSEIDKILRWHELNQSRSLQDQIPPDEEHWLEITRAYTRQKLQQNVLDLSDLIPTAIQAMQKDRTLRAKWNALRTRHLLVDEFQDITPRQYTLINLVTGPTKSVMISTDPNQSINAWRGADAALLDQFRYQHPHAQNYLLKINHRGSKVLSDLATTITDSQAMTGLVHDYQQGIRLRGTKPTITEYDCTPQQMDAHIIARAKDIENTSDIPLDQMAFIYRSKRTINRMASQLANLNIPHTIMGDTIKTEMNDARRIINLLASITNPKDRKAFAIAANTDPKNKKKTLNSQAMHFMSGMCEKKNINMYQAALELLPRLKTGSPIYHDMVYMTNAYNNIHKMLTEDEPTLNNICKRAHNLLEETRKSKTPLQVQDPEVTRLLALSETVSRLKGESPTDHLARFLQLIKTSPYPEHRSQENDDPFRHPQGITCATIHMAKGLQWKVVFVLDVNDHLMPGDVHPDDDSRMKEEQRIFYVASTRATHLLEYSYCTQLTHQKAEIRPSRFLDTVSAEAEHFRYAPAE